MMTDKTRERATNLYFDIEKHFTLGGRALSLVDVQRLLKSKSKSTANYYTNILVAWGLVTHVKGWQHTIILAERNYPPVEWRKQP